MRGASPEGIFFQKLRERLKNLKIQDVERKISQIRHAQRVFFFTFLK